MGLLAFLDSIKARDPAPRSRLEILIYPGVWALAFHRVAHALFGIRLYFLARLVNHMARFLTAIDIHPGATIGKNLFIDHGVGVVIGETAEIGDNVTIYHGVTLGGTDPANGIAGKRHPTISDGAILGSGSQVLGPVIVGERARVGANAVVTKDVPAGAVMIGIPARSTLVDARDYQKSFVPYGTPCSEAYDPATQKLEILQCEVETLRKRLAELAAERTVSAEDADGEPRTPGSRRSRTRA
jgi:serine O-acetyltransferase